VVPKTVLQVFWERAKNCPEKTAILRKVNGKFEPVTWQEEAKIVENVSLSLLDLGVKEEDKIAIMSLSCPEWTWADLAILSLGCVTVPIYPSLNDNEMEYLLKHSEAVGLFIDGKEQLKKLLSLKKIPTGLRFVILFNKDRAKAPEDLQIFAFEKMLDHDAFQKANAKETTAKQTDTAKKKTDTKQINISEKACSIKADELATIVYTSGTTGVPKGVMLNHSNIAFICESLQKAIGFNEDDLALSFLPLSHIFERVGGQFLSIYQGFPMAYAESMDTVAADIAEVKPTMMNAVPRFYEKAYGRIQSQIRHLPTAQQYFSRWALSIGKRALQAQKKSKEEELSDKIYRTELKIADRFVFKKIRERFGGRLRFLASGAAPLSQDVHQFFCSIGLPILEGYGLTETTAPVSCNRLEDNKPGTVGKPLDGIKIKIAKDGEILVKGPSIFSGYYKNPEATAEALSDGWFSTGDIGEIDEQGYLRIKDRKKDLIITAGGKHVAPQVIESLLAGQGIISKVLVYGDRRKYISALITLNKDELESYAKKRGLDSSKPEKLAENKEVIAEVDKAVKAVNLQLASFEQIKRFLILSEDFTVEANELTPTLKLKRKFVSEKYKEQLDSLYDGDDSEPEKARS
jgi:long-chain acyl-CoA synthetase